MGTHKSLRQQAAFVLKNMKVIGAYMLAVVGGNASPSAADCKKILSSMDISLDGDAEKRLTDFVEEMAGKDINEVMAAGHEKLATIPMGGGGRRWRRCRPC